MIEKYVVYTALFGKYDNLRDPQIKSLSKNASFICFTDQENVKSTIWEIVHVAKSEDSDPILLNRFYKMNPHIIFPDFRFSIYIDSNIVVKSNLDLLVNKLISEKIKIAAPRHLVNDCIYQEIISCFALKKINECEKEQWSVFLRNNKYPEHFGLCENNIIFRNHHDSDISKAMDDWWKLFNSGPKRDQLSLMYVLWSRKIPISNGIENSKLKNRFFGIRLHSSNKTFLKKFKDFIYLHKLDNVFCGFIYFFVSKTSKIIRWISA